MNSFVFLPLIAGLFGVIALTSLLWSMRSSRFNTTERKPQPVRIRDQTGSAVERRNH